MTRQTDMKLSLLVQVYNGGDYWRECWKSVLENQDIFEQIFVSISKSPKQEEDIALVRDCRLEKLHWIRQDEKLTSVQHGMRLDHWCGSFHTEGHFFILCHDDILLREGLLKLKELDLKENDAAFGPFRFFSQDGSGREITVREFHRDDNQPITGDLFCFLQDQQTFTYNLSGTVLPSAMFRIPRAPWHFLSYGCRSENCHLCNPYVKRIWQTAEPTVKIRTHAGSEGAHLPPAAMQYDTMVYLLSAFVTYRNPSLRIGLMRSLGYTILTSPLRGIRYFLMLQIQLVGLGYYYPEALKIYGYLLWIAGGKAINLLKRIFHAG